MVAPVKDMTAVAVANGKASPMSGIPTQLLLLHSAECPLRGGYAQSLTEWASQPVPPLGNGPYASWHRFVDPIVRVRMIPDNLQAWHATVANGFSIGWEQAGYARFSRAEWTTPEGLKQLDNLAYDMAEVAIRDGIPAVWLTNDQVRQVLNGNRSIKGFCTHRQVDPASRTDPGSGYPYDLLMTKIKQYIASKGAPTKEEEDMAIEAKDIKAIAAAVWGYPIQQFNEDGSKGTIQPAGYLAGNEGQWINQLRVRLNNLTAQNAAQTKIIEALAIGKGLDPAALQKSMEEAVRNVLGSLNEG